MRLAHPSLLHCHRSHKQCSEAGLNIQSEINGSTEDSFISFVRKAENLPDAAFCRKQLIRIDGTRAKLAIELDYRLVLSANIGGIRFCFCPEPRPPTL